MTAEQAPVDDPELLRSILANAEALLLDFDGPVCSVFAGFPAHLVAHQLRGVLADGGHDELPAEIEKAEDPFDVLRYAAALGRKEAQYVEAAMRAHEVEAVATAHPTPGAHDLIAAWHPSRKLAVVSNNSDVAVTTYLHLHKLAIHVQCVSARSGADLSMLKPSPFLVLNASDALGISPSRCLFVGDSLSDIHAARAAGAPVIGYANKPGKAEKFAEDGALLTFTDMRALVDVVQAIL
ncbi:HAD-IA family hydrolase [Lentzea sp. BCCO 10_0798]|uniref:HAD-IA family hydrolase n=1 Tax=Lentzea kristufekii TaxID=3095430 RepID=A0ABU4TUC0_9PSEU|nr:HAD-IA family hydrolase [Lentzea sp. BCCO 10_0798]MDX8051881.1 HAD-IA family hydrolase [Lentzea sp. BCCO 10_0798]